MTMMSCKSSERRNLLIAAGLGAAAVAVPLLVRNQIKKLCRGRRGENRSHDDNVLQYDANVFPSPEVFGIDDQNHDDDIKLEFAKEGTWQARMERMVRGAQHEITSAMEALDGRAKFEEELWRRPDRPHSGGITRVLSEGRVFEKAGVSVAISSGKLPMRAVQSMVANHAKIADFLTDFAERNPGDELSFLTGSISLVIHPRNPHAPTAHANYRYFEIGELDSDGEFVSRVWWFGGGADLTPMCNLNRDDAEFFHRAHQQACDKHDRAYYSKFKAWCDRYFFIPHRQESRGVGGIFFDDLNNRPREEIFAFARECARTLASAYVPIVARRHLQPYTEAERKWQLIRRGRYVEFNLCYDRGTQFGLRKRGARIESILILSLIHI